MEMSLRDPYAGTTFCLSRRLIPGMEVRLDIKPVASGSRSPRKYHVTIGYAYIDPEDFGSIFSDHLRVTDSSSNTKPWHSLTTLRKSGEISIQFIDDNEIRMDEHLYPLRFQRDENQSICLVFEVFRVCISILSLTEIDLYKFQDLNAYDEISNRVESKVEAVENSLQGESRLVDFPEPEFPELKLDIENAFLKPVPVQSMSSGHYARLSSDVSLNRNQQRISVKRIYEKMNHISRSMEDLKKQSQTLRSDLAVQKVEEIREILEKLLNPPSLPDTARQSRSKTQIEAIRYKLRRNYQKIVLDLDLIGLIDILFEKEVLSFLEYEDLREKHRIHRKDANRDFVGIFLKRPFNVDRFVKAFEDINQGFLLK